MSLGPPIRPPAPQQPEWTPVPGNPHLERNAAGQLRTRLPLPPPELPPIPWPFMGAAPDDQEVDFQLLP